VLPCRSDGCRMYACTISLSRISTSGRCCSGVWTGASYLPNPCLEKRDGIFSNSEEGPDVLPWRQDGCNLELFKASQHWWASGRMIGPSPDENMGSHLSELEFVQNLPWTLEIAFLKYFEDSEIYGIPVKTTTLHNSDFVNMIDENAKCHIFLP
jgi:hypothetical protein